MASVASSMSRTSPSTLRELLESVPQILDAQTPGALDLESCASTDAMEAMARAEERLLKSADTFFPPLFKVSILNNLGRNDPFAEPDDEDFPDQAPVEDLNAERRRLDEITGRVVSEQSHLNSFAERVQELAAHLQGRLEELPLRAQAVSKFSSFAPASGASGSAGLSVLDMVYGGAGDDEKAREAEHLENEKSLRRVEEELAAAAAEAEKVSLLETETAMRADIAQQQREVELLEKEERAAAAALAVESPGSGLGSDAGRRAEASRETENLVGVTGMSESQLEACVREEEALVERNANIRDWYAATVASVELLGGVRLSHRLLFGGAGEVEGMEFMVDLGAGQIMEVTVSAADGRLSSVQLCHSQSTAAAAADAGAPEARGREGGGVSLWELEELRCTADTLPTPQNLRTLVREALGRARRAVVREEHVRLMRRKYLTSYRPPTRELTVTMPAGVVACVRLHVDYPKVAGGAELVKLTGVGGWSAEETEEMCRQVNHLALSTLADTMDALEAAMAAC